MVFLGGLISFVFLKKIQASFNRTHQQEFFRVRNEVTLLIISLVYVYNPFIFERFLMGQHYVLRGHFVFMIALYYLLEFFKYFFNPHPISSKIHEDYIGYKESITNRVLSLFSGQEGSTEYFDRFVKLGLSFIFLALISTHHIIFAYYLIIISTLFYLFSKAIHYQKQKPNWRILLRSSVVLLMVILPSLLILVNRFSGESQLLQISNKNTSQGNSSIKRDIIKSFSLRTIDGQNLAIQGVLGAGSWDSRSFVETLEIESKLGFLSSLSTYYNPMIGFLFVFLFGVVTLSLLYQSDKNFKPLLYPFLLMIPISLVLTFGYSSGMEFINSWFHTLPSSYSLREGGKFYSLFLALISLLFVVYSKYLKTTTKYLAYGTFALYLVSNLLLFWHLGTSIRYVDIENGDYASVFDYVEQKCSLNKKVLYLPFDGYTDSSFSDVYIVNPTKHAIECNVLFPNRSTLVNFEQHNSVLNLEMSQTDQQIDRIVNGFETTSNIDNAFNVFDAQIKSLEVNILIVDEEKYPNLKEFNKK
ncbi:hypothetical protein HC766_06165, partial [Candidatus Gracilibacteria bacterium]|nr:hypothetical protein [Candidatus Gracilibacteria bacterium]